MSLSDKKYIKDAYPLLGKIDSPSDLRKLRLSELPTVCAELRKFMIEALSENPGHFASSMGAVELTVALHYALNTPYDRVVWDVGHQAYSHKILTGRRDEFYTNRKLNGISGFPNPDESDCDSFIAGHASNSISAGMGMAVASRLNKDDVRRNVVAVIGDASIGGGMAFEALNNASINANNLLIVLNDNDMAIDESVGALGEYMTQINTSASYNNLRYKIYKALKKFNLINEKHKGLILRFNNSLKALLSNQQNIFEGLNVRYFGPFDGHDVERVVRVLNDIKDMDGPRILHLRTRKGKGFEVAEKNPSVWHAPGKFDPVTGEIKKSKGTGVLKYQDVFGKTLVELAEKNEKIVGVTAAMPSGTSMCVMQEKIPERTFDVGIAEGHAVTFSAGLAKDGLKPFCAIYSTFLQRAYDSIINDVAILNLPVTFCIDRAGIVGEDGVTHHGAFDLAYLRPIPNLTIASPFDEHELRRLMYTAQLPDKGPFVIRYPRGRGALVNWKCPMEEIPVGKGRKLKDGKDIAVITLGPIGHAAQQAIESVEAKSGKSIAHYDLRFLKPIDEEMLHEIGQNFTQIVTVEDGVMKGGMGSAVLEFMSDNGYSPVIKRIGIPDEFIQHGTPDELYHLCRMDHKAIENILLSF